MRHLRNRSKLSKPTDQRLALIRNQVSDLLRYGHLNTTLPRAKAVQSMAEKLITRAKRGSLADIRLCAKRLPGKAPLHALLYKVAPALSGISSGYTQIAKMKYRRGDGAMVVRLSLRNYPALEAAKK